MKTLLIDNYDSFTFNLYQLIAEVNGYEPLVVRNNEMSWKDLSTLEFDNIVISPGPGRPDRSHDFGICNEIILKSNKPLLGVCLGHQGLCQLLGGNIDYSPKVMHGRSSKITHKGIGAFKNIPNPFSVIRYHSLHVTSLPDSLEAIAWADDGTLMGVQHRCKPLWGVQFHPESICSEYGDVIIKNFYNLTVQHLSNKHRTQKIDSHNTVTKQSVDSITPTKQLRPAHTTNPSNVQFFIEKMSAKIDAESLFNDLFSKSEYSFWLDSAIQKHGARFSYMGDNSGPHAEFISYRLKNNTITVVKEGKTHKIKQDIFSFLDQELAQRFATSPPKLPFHFNLGYVGFFGYELKALCGGQCAHESSSDDAAFIFADRSIIFDHQENTIYALCLDSEPNKLRAQQWLEHIRHKTSQLKSVKRSPNNTVHKEKMNFRHSSEEYLKLIHDCKDKIKQGESYEICLTNMATQNVKVQPWHTYQALREKNPAPYAGFLNFGKLSILSSSPERFLTISPDRDIESKPIKGTRRRGNSPEEDLALYNDLLHNEKDRSENLMIVDLLRNDIGEVSVVGSVHVEKLFNVESYASVHQLVSTVRGKLKPNKSSISCIKSAFPGGSMTGAPKIRTMEIIDELENGPRGIYSGAMGFLSLNGSVNLNIIIRTLIIENQETINIGAGGAIVDLSDPDDEIEEMLLKSKAVTAVFTTK